jgi:hypothetical protein
MQLSICIPARDQVHTVFARSLAYLTSKLTAKNINYDLHIVSSSVIAESRTRLANEALDANATHLLWLDTDLHFPPTVVDTFLKHNKDIVAATYSTRYSPYKNVAFTNPDNIEERLDATHGLHKVWAVGMGCMMIKAEVFDKLPKPWFAHQYNNETDNFSGEDIYFCNQAYKHDIDVWIDADVSMQMAHIGIKANTL